MKTEWLTKRDCPTHNFMHDYGGILTGPDGDVEVCKRCKKKLITLKGPTGRINNLKYLKEHERDTLQRRDPRYKYEYPDKV